MTTEDVDIAEATKAYEAELKSKREQRQRQAITEALADWVWVSEPTAFVRRSDLKVWGRQQWSTHFAHLHPRGDIFNRVMRTPDLIEKFEQLTYLPGGPEVVGQSFNLWRAPELQPREGDVSWFLDHVSYLFEDDSRSAELLLDYMALLVRDPAEKILFALLLHGKEHGTGKSMLARLQTRMLGENNVVQPSADDLNSQFTSWQEGKQLCIVNEMMMLGQQHLANKFKNDITEPYLRIRGMHRVSYSLPNYLNFFLTSNHADAVRLENADRRYLVLVTHAKPRGDDYYDGLMRHIHSDEDVAAVKHYLQHREVKLNPKGKAPLTQAKEDMKEQSLPDAEAYVLELFEEGEWPFDFDLVRRNDLVIAVQRQFRGHHKDLMARMTTLLKERLGAVQLKRGTNLAKGRPSYSLWSIRNHQRWQDTGASSRIDAYMAHRNAAIARGDFRDDDEGL